VVIVGGGIVGMVTAYYLAKAGDAVGQGIIDSLFRPGGNVTGVTNVSHETIGKRLDLLKETVPRLSRVAFLGCLESAVGRQESSW